MNYRLIAVQVGEAIKYTASVNEIDRLAGALFRFSRDQFANEAITSARAQRVYDWVMTLAAQRMDPDERQKLLVKFCRGLVGDEGRGRVDEALISAGIPLSFINQENLSLFAGRDFHPVVHLHARKLFVQGHYFHAVFEVAKAYNHLVREKSGSANDGHSLMLSVWSAEKGVLKLTACQTQTEKNVQNGVGFLSAGLMSAIRNPTAHEPALDWPISRQDALDLLSFVSFLLRQLDKATYFAG